MEIKRIIRELIVNQIVDGHSMRLGGFRLFWDDKGCLMVACPFPGASFRYRFPEECAMEMKLIKQIREEKKVGFTAAREMAKKDPSRKWRRRMDRRKLVEAAVDEYFRESSQ